MLRKNELGRYIGVKFDPYFLHSDDEFYCDVKELDLRFPEHSNDQPSEVTISYINIKQNN